MMIKDTAWDGQQYAFKPDLIGGSIEYTVDLSSVGCGCAAGVYFVKLDAYGCGEDAMTGDSPTCPSLDVMNANKYGFNTAAHPCNGGICDAQSQCEYSMRVEGAAMYGENAYGPNGTMIDTNSPFTVKTEFLSTANY